MDNKEQQPREEEPNYDPHASLPPSRMPFQLSIPSTIRYEPVIIRPPTRDEFRPKFGGGRLDLNRIQLAIWP